ncbi:MAG: hypothetical protein IPM98_19125 [Lewinellaceae bacterium]|nr:hypothetical protein [Lewinellaceae bacterium]
MKGSRFLFVLPLLFFFSNATYSTAQCIEGNCRTGIGTFRFANGDRYAGNWSGGQPHGKGKYYFATKERYEGDFHFGKFEGTGTMYYPDGGYYNGRWKQNLKNGQGRLVRRDGSVAEGTWANGKLATSQPTASNAPAANQQPAAGKPTTSKPSGKTDVANLRNCSSNYCRSGSGYYDYPDGSRWIGAFKNGAPAGQGICYYVGGDRYEGQWANGAPNGSGVLYSANGRATGAVWVNGHAIRDLDSDEVIPNDPVRVEASKNVKIYAVIVGVGRYTAMPSLRFTDDDAYRFYAFLKARKAAACPTNK